MDTEGKNELVINGSGTVGGGTFDKVRINGSGKIVGDIVCDSFQINGSGTLQGTLHTVGGKINGSGKLTGVVEADNFTISGSGQLGADVRGGVLSVNGSGRVEGTADMREIHIDGSLQIHGGCRAEEMQVNGMASIGGDCQCARFHSKGAFTVEGLLNADDIQIDMMHARSRAKEIGGGHIDVRVALVGLVTAFIRSFFNGREAVLLEADSIEGDEIYLEQTRARVVRGRDITLGKGCRVGLVEYTGTLIKLEDADVGGERKV